MKHLIQNTPGYAFATLLLATIVFAAGCSGESQDSQISSPETEIEAADGSLPDGAPPEQAPPGEDPASDEISASHILLMYQGSERAPVRITRTKDEALALATEIVTKAKAEGADFAALAKEHSDCPSGNETGGDLGNFPPRMMAPAFSNAALKLAVGEVSGLVETPFGYHVILRQEVKVVPKVSAKHILVQHEGSMKALEDLTRTREEALARMEECLLKAKEGARFEDLAREYSDGPSGPKGGDLGEFPKGVMAPKFEEAAFACEVGKVTEIVETPFGYHIIYRYK
jgi:peptidyl-prolyl cis-trans isomerase NIMA-interacting 1